MNKALSAGLLLMGITLIIFGISVADVFSSDFPRRFTGSLANWALWLQAGGMFCFAMGWMMTMRPTR